MEVSVSLDTKICQSDLTGIYLGNLGQQTIVYKYFDRIVENRKFDFISIDGQYDIEEPDGISRVDILKILPPCLMEQFCIVIDDYDRFGEKGMYVLVSLIGNFCVHYN